MFATTCKRGLSLFLAVLLCFTAVLGFGTTTAFAAGEQSDVYLVAYPREGDANLDYSGTWGHDNLRYMNGWSSGRSLFTIVRAMGSYEGNICYCIEPGVPLETGDSLSKWGEDFWENYPSDYNHTIEPYEIKQFIGRIMQYGYTGSISTSWRSQNEGADKLAYAVATQLLIWETVVGERDSDFSHVSTGGYNAVTEQIGASHPLRSQIFSYYSMIEANVQSHSKIPSFMSKSSSRAQDIELEWNGSEYTATLTDTNGVLGNYSFSGSGLSFSVSGNTLTITAKTALEDTVTITAEKKDSQRRGIITWSDGHYLPGNATLQDLVTYAESVNDPVTGYLHVKVSYGSAKIIKTSEDGIVSGIRFTITGNGVNETVTTGENGEIQIDNLTPGEYTVTELADDRYVPQESKTVCVVSGQTAIVEFGNILKKFSVTLTKRDSEKGSPQGDAVLSGAVYGIYHGDDLVDTYETDASGSYDAADPDERDVLVCGEDGFAQSKALPYGEYVVEQIKGWDGRELMPAFTVQISEHGKTYQYLINNAEFKAYLKIVKVDAETGKIIPYAGAAFEIYDPDGKLVEMTTTYPQPETHSRFVTNDGGWLITPEMLPYGTGYSIVEVQAPHGYVLNPELVYFDVTAENAESADGITLVIAEKPNTPQKGKIQIVKTGEVFASVTEKDGRYTPVYGESGLAGAEFEICAAEDVFTPDGTLRYAKGDVVDTLTTTADGTAESRELYLGKYEIQETKAPYGMVRDDSVLTAELVYAGQEISITSTSVAVFNERQKVEVKLYKDLEKDELFQIGSGDEILHVYFALYAAEDLTAADGSVIPADGLIEIAGVQADGTLVFASDLPIGSYYVKEYAVDAQYLISEETYPITFTYEDDTTAVVRIEVNNGEAILNRIIRGSITGIKVDEQGEPLPGAVFGLFRADCTDFTEENALLTAESAEDGSFSFENIPYGVWLVREIATSEGYVLSDEIFTVQVSENGAVIELGNLENKPITGELELTKKDISDGKLLPGAGFRIKDADGNVVAEGYTDENGIAKFTLRYGKYTYEEFDAPEGYRIDTTPHEFEITEDGQIVKAEMTNEKIPTPDVPQTGDESNLGFWIGLGSIALGGAIACGILFAKRKKDDDSDE
jgi:LPXTG-motif cell wall-anchored protein